MDGRYCAYLRKSRADEVREKVEGGYDALAHHRQTLESLAERMGVSIARWYRDGIKSGDSIEARPEMKALLADVGNGEWDGVLCMEVERLTRGDMVDQGTVGRAFMESGTLIVTPLKVYDPSSEADMEYFEFGLFMSRREYKAINKRLVAGRVASVREGQYIGTWAPYGYDKAVVDGMKTLVPNGNARFVRAAFQAFADGKSYRDIARMLDAMGAPPSKGAKWSVGSLGRMMRNRVYTGKVVWNAKSQEVYRENGRTRYRTVANDDPMVCDGLHEPIIDDGLWEAAQRRVSGAPVRKAYEHKNYYGRILVCAECGMALHYCDTGNATQPTLSHRNKPDWCGTKGCLIGVIDDAVAASLSGIAEDLELEASEGPDLSRGEYERSIAEAQSAIEANFDRMERGVITEEDFVRRRGVLEARMAYAEEMLASLPTAEERAGKAVRLRECVEAIRDPSVSAEAKRLLLWSVVERIEYRNRAPMMRNEVELEIHLR